MTTNETGRKDSFDAEEINLLDYFKVLKKHKT